MTKKEGVLDRRASGILLHISSLPSRYGVGDFGSEAFRFIDFIKKAGQRYWQILPINPTTSLKANSPYACPSAFAGNTLFINPDFLIEGNFLKKEQAVPSFSKNKGPVFFLPDSSKINYSVASKIKKTILENAYINYLSLKNSGLKEDLENYCSINGPVWLDDYADFKAFKNYFYLKKSLKSWAEWPLKIKYRDRAEMQSLKKILAADIAKEKFCQFIFNLQWQNLKKYANDKGIKIIGDIPIYIDFESADVWSNPEIFKLDNNLKPLFLSGVPPDYYSRTGQLWNNPVYDWSSLEKSGFKWWIERISRNMQLFNVIRIDHFRGFIAYWEVPAGSKTSKSGNWVNGCADKFFNTIIKNLGGPPIIAENLGVITPDVEKTMKKFNFPGIKVLQFAFGKDFPKSSHLPHNYEVNSVVYTGTHDNNTLLGWFKKDAKLIEKQNLSKYLGKEIDASNICDEIICLAEASNAFLAIIPVQDILGLDFHARLNRPATVKNNWLWQLTEIQATELLEKHASKLLKIAVKYSRA